MVPDDRSPCTGHPVGSAPPTSSLIEERRSQSFVKFRLEGESGPLLSHVFPGAGQLRVKRGRPARESRVSFLLAFQGWHHPSVMRAGGWDVSHR